MAPVFYIGKRVSYDGNRCTVRYVGPIIGAKGDWLGVEWDDQSRGKHWGEAGGIRYFECMLRMHIIHDSMPLHKANSNTQVPAKAPRLHLSSDRQDQWTQADRFWMPSTQSMCLALMRPRRFGRFRSAARKPRRSALTRLTGSWLN
jgi:hypothetical protein